MPGNRLATVPTGSAEQTLEIPQPSCGFFRRGLGVSWLRTLPLNRTETERKMGKYSRIDKKIIQYAIGIYGPKGGTRDERLRVALSKMGLEAPPAGAPYWRHVAAQAIAARDPMIRAKAERVVGNRQRSKAAKRARRKLYQEGAYQAPRKPKEQVAPHDAVITAFYSSWEWARVRYDFIKGKQRRCECCGAGPETSRIVVDHIKPIRKYWHLRLDPKNLQMLCDPCNMGKGSRDETDWRNVVEMPASVLIPKSVTAP